MNFHLLISDAYKLIIGDGNHLVVGGGSTSKARRWDGNGWVTFNSVSHFNGTTMVNTVNVRFYNGSTWENLF